MNSRRLSLNHLVGEREHLRRNGKPERFGGLEIDYQLELGRRQHRQISGIRALENLRGVDAALAIRLGDAHAIAQKSARNSVFAKVVDCGQSLLCGELNYPVAPGVEIRIRGDQQRASTLPL